MIETSVGAVIFRKGNTTKYLLLQYNATHWGLVKGHIEKGESEEETLLRETKEETGIINLQIIPKFRKEYSYSFKRKNEVINKQVIIYLAKTQTKEIKLSEEHIGYCWLNYEEAIKKVTFNQPKELIKKANEKIQGFSGV